MSVQPDFTNSDDSSVQDRANAIGCWRQVMDRCGLQEKVLADAAGMSASHFSKVSNGLQGDLLGLVIQIGRTYPAVRRAFILALAELEGADPLVHAAEQAAHACMRFMRLMAEAQPMRMASVALPEQKAERRRA